MLKYIAKRYKWKYGIKYATYCFFYLNIIYIFVAEKERYIYNLREQMVIRLIHTAVTRKNYLDIWRNIKNLPS